MRRLLLPVAAGLLLAGCGGGDGAPEPKSDMKTFQDAQLAFARCMRDHGVDMPDPEFDEQGRVTSRGPSPATQEKFKAAEPECRTHLRAFKAPELTPAQQEEMVDLGLEHARCLREQGFTSLPDPVTDSDGSITITLDRAAGMGPEFPRFRKAMKACEDSMPPAPFQP